MQTFFIVGCPRSGTTVLQQALNRHDEVVIPPETKFFCCFYKKSLRQQRAHWRRLCDDLKLDLPPPNRSVRQPEQARQVLHQIARTYCQQQSHRSGPNPIAWFGEKTPEHTSRLPWIREVFPEAKILFLYRDGRDVALSLTSVPWIRCNIYSGFLIWLYYFRFLQPLWRTSPSTVLFLKYEQLVTDPAGELRRVLDFLQLPWQPRVAFGHGNRDGILDRELSWKGRALEPITADRVGLWRTQLSPRQVARLERLGGRALEELGYELATGGRCRLGPLFWGYLALSLFRTAGTIPLGCLWSELRSWAAHRSLQRGADASGGTVPDATVIS